MTILCLYTYRPAWVTLTIILATGELSLEKIPPRDWKKGTYQQVTGQLIELCNTNVYRIARYAVRSEDKAKVIFSDPAMNRFSHDHRLSAVSILDFTVDGALEGTTHVIQVGSPVAIPTSDPMAEIFEPTAKASSGLLSSAIKSPSVQRIFITSSVVRDIDLIPSPYTVSASTSAALLTPLPTSFGNVPEAYVLSKIADFHNTAQFVRTQNPDFTVPHVVPGYMVTILREELPFPLHRGAVYADDVAETHLRVALLRVENGTALCQSWTYTVTIASYTVTLGVPVEKVYPKAEAAGVFKLGKALNLPFEYDSSDTIKLLGRKYLEKLGVEKA
ncbi:putative cinnamoyl-CoA reductase [Hypoxylon sp. NC1633]|nr:putative cinnamoyl-CoA reductase [Hypoxylon sp. NC1633]